MTPNVNFIVSEIDEKIQTSKTYKIDMFNKRILGKIDEKESIKQAIYKILQTERFENVIYNSEYGIELNRFIGTPEEFIKSDIERTIKEALEVDERILTIENFNIIESIKDVLKISFSVRTIYGNINFDSEVKI